MAAFQNRRFSKSPIIKIFFVKISWIGPWFSRIEWCQGHYCSSTYMVVRLSDVSSKTGKNAFFVFLGCFCTYVGHPHDHIGWAISMPFTSINPTNPRTNQWNFCWKILRIGAFEKWPFWKTAILEFIFEKLVFCFIPMKISHQEWVEILTITLVYSKRVSVPNNLLYSVSSRLQSKITLYPLLWDTLY